MDEDIQNLLDQDAEYELIDSTENPDASREELVEILSNNVVPVKKIEVVAESQADTSQEDLEVYMIDDDDGEAAEFEEYYLEEDYDGEMVSEEFSDEQYLDDEYEAGDSLVYYMKFPYYFYPEIFLTIIFFFYYSQRIVRVQKKRNAKKLHRLKIYTILVMCAANHSVLVRI